MSLNLIARVLSLFSVRFGTNNLRLCFSSKFFADSFLPSNAPATAPKRAAITGRNREQMTLDITCSSGGQFPEVCGSMCSCLRGQTVHLYRSQQLLYRLWIQSTCCYSGLQTAQRAFMLFSRMLVESGSHFVHRRHQLTKQPQSGWLWLPPLPQSLETAQAPRRRGYPQQAYCSTAAPSVHQHPLRPPASRMSPSTSPGNAPVRSQE